VLEDGRFPTCASWRPPTGRLRWNRRPVASARIRITAANVIAISLPPPRERRQDIPDLVE
jgi:hypothetical protein